ncbi:MAG: nuclear transport factor 2 family protein [Candidatus Korobacteraceae bacterium]
MQELRHKLLIALAVAVLATGMAAASENTEVMAPVHQFVDGFNHGDTTSALAACADQTSIIDEFPPHEWHGAGACTSWMNDYIANAKKNGISDGIVTLGKPWHIDVTADRAYVVVPANYSFKINGKPMKETGSTFIFALQKTNAGWRITGWAWGQR